MNHIIKIILAISLISSAGCRSAEITNTTNTATVATNATSTSAATDNTTPTNPANTINPPSETIIPVSESPMETLKKLNAASLAKNPTAIKKTLSKGSIALIEKSAANQKKSVDQLLSEENGAPFKFKEMPEMRNQTINGNIATVEVKPKNETEWQLIPLVAEDGEWKFALDVFFQNAQQQAMEQLRKNQSK